MSDDRSLDDERTTKPGFDARKHFYELMSKYLNNIAIAQYSRDVEGWATLIQGILSLVRPYVKSDDCKAIDNRLKVIISNRELLRRSPLLRISSNRSIIDSNHLAELQQITDNLYLTAKHLMLPTKGDDETEFDEKTFKGGS